MLLCYTLLGIWHYRKNSQRQSLSVFPLVPSSSHDWNLIKYSMQSKAIVTLQIKQRKRATQHPDIAIYWSKWRKKTVGKSNQEFTCGTACIVSTPESNQTIKRNSKKHNNYIVQFLVTNKCKKVNNNKISEIQVLLNHKHSLARLKLTKLS